MSDSLRRALVALVAVAALVLPLGLLAATPAPAVPAAAPTLAALAPTAQAGQVVEPRGTAPARAVVVLQQRWEQGPWRRVGAVRASATGRWSRPTRLGRAGLTSFRAVSGGKASGARTVKSFQWISAARQPHLLQATFAAVGATQQVDGQRLAGSVLTVGPPVLVVRTGRRCTVIEAWAGLSDRDDAEFDGDESARVRITRIRDGSFLGSTSDTAPAGQGAVLVDTPAGGADVVAFFAQVEDPGGDDQLWYLIGAPRLYCYATSLPAIQPEDAPL